LPLQLSWQVAEVQHRPGRKGAGALHRILQLAHVARPVVLHHGSQGVVAQGELGAVVAADAVKEMRCKKGYIFAAVA
jgi:hypothetical protein